MAASVKNLSHKYKNIFVICGYGQTRSIPHYMYFGGEENQLVRDVARRKAVYENLVRKDTPEMQTDKLVLVDSILSGTTPNPMDT